MKTINRYVLVADNEKEYDEFVDNSLKDAFDISFYLNLLESSQGKLLSDLIEANMDFFDSKNICLDYKQIKADLGLVGHFAKILDANKPLDANNISIDVDAATFPSDIASGIALQIHDILFKTILDLKGIKLRR